MVDFLVEELGVGYLKMDYNINVAPGPSMASARCRRRLAGPQPGLPGLG